MSQATSLIPADQLQYLRPFISVPVMLAEFQRLLESRANSCDFDIRVKHKGDHLEIEASTTEVVACSSGGYGYFGNGDIDREVQIDAHLSVVAEVTDGEALISLRADIIDDTPEGEELASDVRSMFETLYPEGPFGLSEDGSVYFALVGGAS